MLKRVISLCLVFIIALVFFAGTALAAPPEYTGEMNDGFNVMLIDADSGTVLYEQNADEQIYPASTTKIMTTIVALENASSLDEKITISAACDWTKKPGDYSILKIRKGEEISIKDLLYGMMVVSGDDAAEAIAEKIGGSISGFVDMMNAKAKELGMDSTLFANAGGLDKPDPPHVTVRDMAKLTIYAMKNPTFRDIVSRETYDMPETTKQSARTITNTNKLLDSTSDYYYEYANGVKTGSTPNAGGCLVSSAAKNGMNLICLVYGEKPSSKTQRWKISKELLQWGFDNWKNIDVTSLLKPVEPVMIQDSPANDAKGGLLEFIQPEASKAYVTLPKDDAQMLSSPDAIEVKTTFDKDLVAPIAEGDIMGKVTYTIKSTGNEIYSYNLIAARDISEAPAVAPSSPVVTMKPTESPKTVEDNNPLFTIFLIVIPGGLIVFLIIRMIMSRRSRSRYRKRRRPHYTYRR